LRESRTIGQDADLVSVLEDEKVDKKKSKDDEGERDNKTSILNIHKQKDGPVCKIRLTFLKEYLRFESAAKVSPEDYPEERQML